MPYQFDKSVLSAIPTAFSSAVIQSDLFEHSDRFKRDYFFISFSDENKLTMNFDEKNSVNILLNGDKKMTEYGNQALFGLAKAELGFRWSALAAESKKIILLGFCIKIIYAGQKKNLQQQVIKIVCNILKSHHLVNSDDEMEKNFPLSLEHIPNKYIFLQPPVSPVISQPVLLAVKEYISMYIEPIFPAYIRSNETGINPAYQDITATRDKLFLHEKKIWLLRSDMILAVGNKNAYWVNFDEKGLSDAIDSKLHHYINWEDRYGHPSLAVAYPGYQSGAFYAGLLAQRNGCLEVFTSSGRYHRGDLTVEDKTIIEAYVTYYFQKAYGRQPIVFIDSLSNEDYFECALFYNDKPLPDYCAKRRYDFLDIERIFECVVSKHYSMALNQKNQLAL